MFGQLLCHKGTKVIYGKEYIETFLQMVLNNWISEWKKSEPRTLISPHIKKINLRWKIYQNTKAKTIKLSVQNTGDHICDLGVRKDLLLTT